jgi:hypothetical protein
MELLEGFEDIVKIITVAPEINGAINLIKKVSGMGIIVSMGHSDATYAEAESGFRAGARGITHIFNAMRSIHHREPGIAGFGLLNRDIYIEVIADPYHLHPRTLELVFKIKTHDRILLVSDTVKETEAGGCGMNGVTDSAGILLGGGMTITESSRRLMQLGFDEGDIIACITKNPANYLQGNRWGGGFMDKKIIIYGKGGWPYTDKARSAYGEADYFDVKLDSAKLEEMLALSGGVRKVPVIVEEGKETVGYGGSWGVWLPAGAGQNRPQYQEKTTD